MAHEQTYSCRVVRIDQESASARSFYLAPVHGALPQYAPGQFVVIRPGDGMGEARPCVYSLSTRPGLPCYRLTADVMAKDGERLGAGSCRAALGRLREGMTVTVSHPRGRFVLPRSERGVALVSAGIGITPVYAMLDALVHSGDSRRVWFAHGARSSQSHVFRAAVAGLVHPGLSVLTAYSRPEANDQRGRDYDIEGRLGATNVLTAVDGADADFMLCGPETFLREMRAGLIAGGVPATRIHTEAFGLGATSLPVAPGGPAAIRFERSGIVADWNPRFDSLLELAEAQGLQPPYDCRAGICGICRTTANGEVDYTVESRAVVQPGEVLICCSRPRGPLTLDL